MDAQKTPSASARDVAARALALANDGRWRELVALADEDALEEHRREVVENERRRAEPVRSMRADLPDAVRQWFQTEYERNRQHDRIEQRYVGVQSIEELSELSAAELLAREVEAGEAETRANARRAGLSSAAAEEAVGIVAEQGRRLIGMIDEGAYVSHALYRLHTHSGDLQLMTLRRTHAGWRIMPGCELFAPRPSGFFTTNPEGTGVTGAYAPPAVAPTPWLERTFPSGLPAGLFPALLARFDGNLLRINATLHAVSHGGRTTRPPSGGWSMQEHAGHLLALERLGEIRLGEFERGADVLSAADMQNRATKDADYNSLRAAEIVAGLHEARGTMIARLERLTRAQIEHSALHPRLQQPMNVVDWLFFMCEHDDHHLAHMRILQHVHWRSIEEAQPR